jgi:hypothetical protein
VGYFYPDTVHTEGNDTALSSLVQLTGDFMAKADMRIVNVLG